MKKELFLLTILAVLAAPAWSAASRASGVWSSTDTWQGFVLPLPGETVTVTAGHTVVVDGGTLQCGPLHVRGTLSFSTGAVSSLALSGGDLRVYNNGALLMGTESIPMDAAGRAEIVLASTTASTPYRLRVEQNAVFEAHGHPVDPVLSVATAQNDTSLVLPGAPPAGWVPGAELYFVKTHASGTKDSERRVISGVSGTGPSTISWADPLDFSHTGSRAEVRLLTRNVLIRSAGTVLSGTGRNTSEILTDAAPPSGRFRARHAEFAGMDELTLYWDSRQSEISSCTVRDGYRGILLVESATGHVIQNSAVIDNEETGFHIDGQGASLQNRHSILRNFVAGQGSSGIYLNDASRVRISGNLAADNNNGIDLDGAPLNVVEENLSWGNRGWGIFKLYGSSCVYRGNEVFLNQESGMEWRGSLGWNNIAVDNRSFQNSYRGFVFGGTQDVVLNPHSWANQGDGFQFSYGRDTRVVGGGFGYRPDGTPDQDLGGITLDDSGNSGCRFMGTRIHPSNAYTPYDSTPGKHVLFMNVNTETGTVRVNGEWTLSGEDLLLDNALPTWNAQATVPLKLIGSGHETQILSVDENAFTQHVRIEYSGGNWTVTGSSSGVMGVFTQASPPSNAKYPTDARPEAFRLTFTPGNAPEEGDRVDFAVIGGSGDAGIQKRLLFENGPGGVHQQESRLIAPPGSAVTLRGDAVNPLLIDRALSTGRYFHIVSSGTFTAEHVSFRNVKAGGLSLSGSGPVAISSSSFDQAGLATGSNAYLTARDLSSNATFYALTFGNARLPGAGQTLQNVRVVGADAGLAWALSGWTGPYAGPQYENDPNGRVRWLDSTAPGQPSGLAAAPSTGGAVRLNWTIPGNDGGGGYFSGVWRVFHSTDPADIAGATPDQAQTQALGAGNPGDNASLDVPGLLIYATHYFRLWAGDDAPNWSPPAGPVDALPPLEGPRALFTPSALAGGYIPLNASFSLGFDKAVQSGSVSVSARRVRNNLGVAVDEPVSGTLSGAGQSFSFVPDAPLAGNSLFDFSVSSGVLDGYGAPSTAPVTSSFATLMNRSEENLWSDGAARVSFSAGALSQDGYALAQALAPAAAASATRKLQQRLQDPFAAPAGGIYDITVHDAAGAPQNDVFGADVLVSLPYDDADGNGVVDGTHPPVSAKTLSLHWLDESHDLWVRLPSQVDPATRRVTARAPHFTSFALLGQADDDVSRAYAFPSPFKPALGHTNVVFSDLPQIATVRIFTLSGRLVQELSTSDGTGQISWNVTNKDGEPLQSGVYLYVVSNGRDKIRGKLGVVR